MKERPILFNSEMVRAILENRKSQTRRVIKPQPEVKPSRVPGLDRVFQHPRLSDHWEGESIFKRFCPHGQPGDRLLVAMEIPGAPKTYCAGSDGKIYSRARGDWRPLKEWKNQKGYGVVTISDGPKKRTKHLHALVCAAFYGEKPSSSHQVRHLNGDPADGRPENLAWGTQEENWMDRKAHGKGNAGENHHAAKFSNDERDRIRWAIEKGLCSQRHAARVLGVTQSSISQLMRGSELIDFFVTAPRARIPRITLEVTDVRVERVQEISEQDAESEGFQAHDVNDELIAARTIFAEGWDSINASRGFGWDQNPFVWVVEFRRVECSTN